ncbi:hypothetical protein MMC29_006950 [Sticta canariensis]|nr:hypothetical protein [Sticta canariensis]
MRLLSFPIEIILQIVKEVSPEDIEQLAMSCKKVYILAGERLRKHAEMKRKYNQLVLCNFSHMDIKKVDPASILRDVLVNDQIAFYPQDIIIGSLSYRVRQDAQEELALDAPVHSEDFDAHFFEDVQDRLLAKLQGCPYLNDYNAQSLRKSITEGHQLASVALLITLFPNLRSMRVYPTETLGDYVDDRFVHEMVLTIAKASSASERPIPSPALSKLSVVELHTGLDFGDLLSFAALPSMRYISGMGLSSYRFDVTSGMDMSGLRSLKLSMGKVKCDSLIKLLGGIKALKIFIYHNGEVEFQPRRILTVLAERAAHSLTHLTLTNPSIQGPRPILADCYFGSLRCFQSLKEIIVDRKIFCRPIEWTMETYEGEHIEAMEPMSYQVARLVDMLPQSTEIFCLAGEYMNQQDVSALIDGLSEREPTLFPRLREIIQDDLPEGRILPDDNGFFTVCEKKKLDPTPCLFFLGLPNIHTHGVRLGNELCGTKIDDARETLDIHEWPLMNPKPTFPPKEGTNPHEGTRGRMTLSCFETVKSGSIPNPL